MSPQGELSSPALASATIGRRKGQFLCSNGLGSAHHTHASRDSSTVLPSQSRGLWGGAPECCSLRAGPALLLSHSLGCLPLPFSSGPALQSTTTREGAGLVLLPPRPTLTIVPGKGRDPCHLMTDKWWGQVYCTLPWGQLSQLPLVALGWKTSPPTQDHLTAEE